jgi:hypothetical protein
MAEDVARTDDLQGIQPGAREDDIVAEAEVLAK